MIGRPKYSDKDLMNIFDPKKYAMKIGIHFSTHLQQIQEKINMMKASIKLTEECGMQTTGQEQVEQEKEQKSLVESNKVTNIKN